MNGHQDEFSHEHRWLVQKAKRLAAFCRDHRFIGWECMLGMKLSKLSAFYNGIGPDWDWNVIENIVKHIDPIFEPAAFVQDIQYRVAPDRSEGRFHQVNYEFYQNCLKCIELGNKWWQMLRKHRLRRSAKVLFDASEEYGFSNWQSFNGASVEVKNEHN